MNFQAMTDFLDSIPLFGAPGVDCLIQRNGEVIYRHMAGLADRENGLTMQGCERFYLYSLTKLVTCTAAMQLFEQGKFLLSDTLGTYLPEFGAPVVKHIMKNGDPRILPATHSIEIGQLFSMTAGFNDNFKAPSILDALSKNQNAGTREMVRAIAKEPLSFEPGTHWKYGLSHDVIGALIEVISGQTFGEYLKEHIFDPLDMKDTGFHVKSGMMAQYRLDEQTGKPERISLDNEYVFSPAYDSGGAGLISSVDDYSKFICALANGGTGSNGARILSPFTIELMRTNRLKEQQLLDYDWLQFRGYGYGLGVRVLIDKAEAGSPGPLGEFGWAGAGGCYALIDPENHISMFYAQQMLNSLEAYIHPRLRNILYSCI